MTLTEHQPCTDEIFDVIVRNIKFTRYLRLDTCDSEGAHRKLMEVMDALGEVALRFFSVERGLNTASYVYLARVLNDPVGCKNLLSVLSTLSLPIRSVEDTRSTGGKGGIDLADAMIDCNARIIFTSIKHGSGIPHDLGAPGHYCATENLVFGTPYRIIRSVMQLFGIKYRRMNELWLHGDYTRLNRTQRTNDNPFISYGIHFPNKPL
jgi:hypothetical protein